MRWKVVVGIFLLVLGMWWTRYQTVGQVGGPGLKAVSVRDRLTGKFWVISGLGAMPQEWKNWEKEILKNKGR